MEQCPLCRSRAPRRFCPALGRTICSVCCGTKRGIEISCPDACPYLSSAKAHPAAVVRRQEEHDTLIVRPLLDGMTKRQSQLCFMLVQPALGFRDPLLPVTDADLADAARSLAATYQTAASGLIYEHRPGSFAAGRLFDEMKRMLAEAGIGSSRELERDAVEVLRRIEKAVDEARHVAGRPTSMLEALGRVHRAAAQASKAEAAPGRLDTPGQGLIIAP